MHCALAGHAPRSVSVPMISRSRYCWGTAAIEITGIAHISGGRVGDGFALFPPAFPRSSALSGRKPALQFFPLEWECANLQQFLSKKIYIACSEWLACCRGWAEKPQSCSSSSFRNVTSRTLQRSRSQSGAPGPKTDLRIIIFALGAKRINIGFLPSALHSRPD